MPRFDRATYLSLLLKLIFSERLKNSLSILFYKFIEFIILLYTFLVFYFSRYKEYIICLFLFSKFSDVLPAFTYARAIGKFWSICLGVNILNCVRSKTLWSKTLVTQAKRAKLDGRPLPFVAFIGNIFILNASRFNSRTS